MSRFPAFLRLGVYVCRRFLCYVLFVVTLTMLQRARAVSVAGVQLRTSRCHHRLRYLKLVGVSGAV